MTAADPFIMDCDLHDYLEIACLFHYRVRLILTDQAPVDGIARTTLTESGSREYLRLDIGSEHRDIELHRIKQLEVLTPNARFSDVRFR